MVLCRQAIEDAAPAGLAISPSAPTGNATLVPAPAGPASEQESLGIHQDRRSGVWRRAPWCQGNDASGLAECQHAGTSRGVHAREGVFTCRGGRAPACAGGTARWSASSPGALPLEAAYGLQPSHGYALSEAKVPSENMRLITTYGGRNVSSTARA
jgi:hypothetical protein